MSTATDAFVAVQVLNIDFALDLNPVEFVDSHFESSESKRLRETAKRLGTKVVARKLSTQICESLTILSSFCE